MRSRFYFYVLYALANLIVFTIATLLLGWMLHLPYIQTIIRLLIGWGIWSIGENIHREARLAYSDQPDAD